MADGQEGDGLLDTPHTTARYRTTAVLAGLALAVIPLTVGGVLTSSAAAGCSAPGASPSAGQAYTPAGPAAAHGRARPLHQLGSLR